MLRRFNRRNRDSHGRESSSSYKGTGLKFPFYLQKIIKIDKKIFYYFFIEAFKKDESGWWFIQKDQSDEEGWVPASHVNLHKKIIIKFLRSHFQIIQNR